MRAEVLCDPPDVQGGRRGHDDHHVAEGEVRGQALGDLGPDLGPQVGVGERDRGRGHVVGVEARERRDEEPLLRLVGHGAGADRAGEQPAAFAAIDRRTRGPPATSESQRTTLPPSVRVPSRSNAATAGAVACGAVASIEAGSLAPDLARAGDRGARPGADLTHLHWPLPAHEGA